MKFKIGDKVLVTAGKDKGMKSEITAVFAKANEVVVKGANYYVKNVKPIPMLNRPGERIRKERPLSTAKIAILNEKDQADRVGYKTDASGKKVRFFKKTKTVIEQVKKETKKEVGKKTEKKSSKAETKKKPSKTKTAKKK